MTVEAWRVSSELLIDTKLEVCNRAGAKLQASMWNKCVVGAFPLASVTLVPQLITTLQLANVVQVGLFYVINSDLAVPIVRLDFMLLESVMWFSACTCLSV